MSTADETGAGREHRGRWYDRVQGGAATIWFLLLGLALVVSLAWGIGQRQARRAQAIWLEMERQRAFEQLVDRAETIEVLLAKGLVTNSGCAGSLVFTELWHQGMAAQEDIADLPLAHFSIANTSKFVTQVADLAHYLVRRCSLGEELTDADWGHLATLHQAAGELSMQLHDLSRTVLGGGFRWSLVGAARTGAAVQRVQDGFGDIAAHMQDLPTLIYDGPFSDHIELTTPKGLLPGTVTVEEAIEVARRFAPSLAGAAAQEQEYQAIQVGDVPGALTAYALALRPVAGAQGAPSAGAAAGGSLAAVRGPAGAGGGGQTTAGPEIRIDVSKTGGQVIWFLVQGLEQAAPAPGGAAEQGSAGYGTGPETRQAQAQPPPDAFGPLDEDLRQAVEQARQFLESRGLTDIVATYSAREGDVAVCQFAAVQDGIVLYPDLLQVKVRLADGQVMGYNAVDYLMSHTPRRELPEPAVSVAEAQAKLNPRVTVHGQRLVVIPTPSLNEILCREFHVSLNEDPFLVYINALTGDEEAIFKLIRAEDGGSLVF